MRVMATVQEHDVEVVIGADEIEQALRDTPNELCTWVIRSVGEVLKAISDFQIQNQMNPEQRAIVRKFLREQADRYTETELIEQVKAP